MPQPTTASLDAREATRDVQPSRSQRIAPAAFRAVITVHALAVFSQPVVAGRLLNGDFDMLALHRTVGILAGTFGFVQLLLAVVCRRICRGSAWPVLACLGLAMADSLQIFLGFDREIGLHVPLGVGIVASTLLLLVSAWRSGFGVAGHVSSA